MNPIRDTGKCALIGKPMHSQDQAEEIGRKKKERRGGKVHVKEKVSKILVFKKDETASNRPKTRSITKKEKEEAATQKVSEKAIPLIKKKHAKEKKSPLSISQGIAPVALESSKLSVSLEPAIPSFTYVSEKDKVQLNILHKEEVEKAFKSICNKGLTYSVSSEMQQSVLEAFSSLAADPKSTVVDAFGYFFDYDLESNKDGLALFTKKFLLELPQKIRENIADHAAEYLLFDRDRSFPDYGNKVILSLFSHLTNHASLQQLFAAARIDNSQRLLQCLNSSNIDPYKRCILRENSIPLSLLEVALMQNSLQCLEVILEKGIFSKDKDALPWRVVQTSEAFERLVHHKVPLSDKEASLLLPRAIKEYERSKNWTNKKTISEGWLKIIRKLVQKMPHIVDTALLEELYFDEFSKRRDQTVIKTILPYSKGQLSERMIIDMQDKVAIFEENEWLEYLSQETQTECIKKQKSSLIIASGDQATRYDGMSTSLPKKKPPTEKEMQKRQLACERAKKKLQLQGVKIDEIETFDWMKPKEQVFDFASNYLIRMGMPDTERLHEYAGDKLLSKPQFQKIMRACLEEMGPELCQDIADCVAEPLVTKIFCRDNEQALIKVICPYAKKPSLFQLYAGVYLDDPQKVASCIASQDINILTQKPNWDNSHSNILQFALLYNNLRVVKILVESGVFQAIPHQNLGEVCRSAQAARMLVDASFPLHSQDARNIFSQACSENSDWHNAPIVIGELARRFPSLADAIEETGKTALEELYSLATVDKKKEEIFQAIYPHIKEKFTDRLLLDMKNRILTLGEKKWLAYLPESIKKDYELAQSSPQSQVNDTIRCVEGLQAKLLDQLELHNLDPESMDAEMIFDAYMLMRKVRLQCKSPDGLTPTEASQLKKAYDAFVKVYDEVVDRHPIYAHVRFFSRKVRQIEASSQELPRDLQKFLDLWIDQTVTRQNALALWKTHAPLVRKRIFKAHAEVMKLPQEMRWIQLLHGTNSAAIPLILKTGKKLQASGKLFEQGIVPLTGEGTGAVDGVNVKGISILHPDRDWEQEKIDLPGTKTTSHYLVAEGYATRTLQNTNFGAQSLVFDREKEYEVIKKACEKISSGSSQVGSHLAVLTKKFLFDLKRAIMRLKMTENSEFMKTSKELRKVLEQADLKEILEVLDAAPKIQVNPADPLIVKRYPVLFASSHYELDLKNQLPNDEIVIEKSLQLGQDIDILFTTEEAMEPIKSSLDGTGITILPLDAGRYLQMMQMVKAKRHLTNSQIGLKGAAKEFHSDILPYYTTPFPAKPTYKEGDRVVLIEDPFFGNKFASDHAAYLKAVEKGLTPAKSIHGPMHATRVALYSLMLMNIYASKGRKITVEPHLLMKSAGFHDAARQDEGVDHWDDESGTFLKKYLLNRVGVKKDHAAILVHALQHKDPTEIEGYVSDEQRIIHDSDVLEIVRVLLMNSDPKSTFDYKELALLRLPQFSDFNIKELVHEIIEFVKVTENPALQIYLERRSTNYFADVVSILQALQTADPKRFPIMTKHLQSVMQEVGHTLDPKILAMIHPTN